jgi:hypothetical protein
MNRMTSRYRHKCCGSDAVDPASIPKYVPKCCPAPVNRDPRRFERYCPPVVSRSEPLSHAEYLRKLKENRFAKPSSAPVTVGDGKYKRTDWMESGAACCPGAPLVPTVKGKATADTESSRIDARDALIARTTKPIPGDRPASLTTLVREGAAIAADKGCCK